MFQGVFVRKIRWCYWTNDKAPFAPLGFLDWDAWLDGQPSVVLPHFPGLKPPNRFTQKFKAIGSVCNDCTWNLERIHLSFKGFQGVYAWLKIKVGWLRFTHRGYRVFLKPFLDLFTFFAHPRSRNHSDAGPCLRQTSQYQKEMCSERSFVGFK